MHKLNGRNESVFYKISKNKSVTSIGQLASQHSEFNCFFLTGTSSWVPADASRTKSMMDTALHFREVGSLLFLPRGGG